jgi:hypothetical protein
MSTVLRAYGVIPVELRRRDGIGSAGAVRPFRSSFPIKKAFPNRDVPGCLGSPVAQVFSMKQIPHRTMGIARQAGSTRWQPSMR